MNKKKVLKIIGIILLIIIIIISINTIRNYIIITDLQNKITKYSDKTNYHIKSIAKENNGTIVSMEYYKKDNKQVLFLNRNLNGEITKISIYDNGERIDRYTDTEDSKIAQLNSGELLSINIYNFLETENNWQTFLSSIVARVRTTEYNGKQCYAIQRFLSLTSLTSEDGEIYIDKETGLFLKTTESIDRVTEREYEFDNVDDSIFVEPDISQYTLK